jgi:septum formation protein
MTEYQLFLASRSPRRFELLQQLGLDPQIRPAGIEETGGDDETPADLVARLSREKAQAAAQLIGCTDPPGIILAADTSVVLDGNCLGKPSGTEDAQRMLRALRGREHHVLTGVWLIATDDGRASGGVQSTRVVFNAFDDATLTSYASSTEPLDKAGAYAIQGRGALLCHGIEGSWSNVVGLPLESLPGWFAEIGVRISWRDQAHDESYLVGGPILNIT